MIKGGGTINNQVNEAYAGGGQGIGGKGGKNGSFYQSKYMSNTTNQTNMNQSPSPSQTFFKENPHMMMLDKKVTNNSISGQ